jgi:hypothetical protein
MKHNDNLKVSSSKNNYFVFNKLKKYLINKLTARFMIYLKLYKFIFYHY